MKLKISSIKGNSVAPEYWASKNLGERGEGDKNKSKTKFQKLDPTINFFFFKTIWNLLQEAFYTKPQLSGILSQLTRSSSGA
jgi:hypothetical protein